MTKILSMLICMLMVTVTVKASADFTVVSSTQARQGRFATTSYVVQNGQDPLNRFGVERVTLASLSRFPLQPVILEPSLANSSLEYTVGASSSDFSNSIAASLASAALDVYLYSPRETLLSSGQCSAPGSCQEAAGWGFAADIADLEFVKALAASQDRLRPVIGGYSLGGIIGLAAANTDPGGFSGLLLIDSPITTPTLAAGYETLCQTSLAAIASGQVVDPSFPSLANLLVQLELANPTGATPVPIFPPGTTNRQAYIGFFTAPQAGPPASIFPPGFMLVSPDGAGGFAVASEQSLNTQVEAFNAYVPEAVFRDVECSFAGDTTFTSNLKVFQGPVLTLEFTSGFGALDEDNLSLLGTRDSDIVRYPNFSHLDALTAPVEERREVLDDVIVGWIYGDVIF